MHLSAGLLTAIHVPSEKLQKQRSLIRFRKRLSGDLTRAKNRLKSELRFQGIVLPKEFDKPYWSYNFLGWIEQQARKDEDLQDTLLLLLEEIKLLRVLLLKTERRLRELMHSEEFRESSRLLRTIPGVGPLLATLFLLEVGDVSRFQSFDGLNRYVGFCPDEHSSGATKWQQGISRRKHSQLRGMLTEAAWRLVRIDPAILDYYKTLTGRMKGQQAIIRIARKLLRRMRAVLLSKKTYVRGIDGNLYSKDIAAPLLPALKKKGRPKKMAVS
jgi:transposase